MHNFLLGYVLCFLFGLASICSVNAQDCKGDEFLCPNTNICLPETYVCDGYADCPTFEDEKQNCPPCFYCDDGECLPPAWHCDWYPDCSDASDEVSCTRTCRDYEFQCDNERCIKNEWLCDGYPDCGPNAEDETNCTVILGCADPSNEAKCTGLKSRKKLHF